MSGGPVKLGFHADLTFERKAIYISATIKPILEDVRMGKTLQSNWYIRIMVWYRSRRVSVADTSGKMCWRHWMQSCVKTIISIYCIKDYSGLGEWT